MHSTRSAFRLRTRRPVESLAIAFDAADADDLEIPEDLTALSAEDLDALHARATEAFRTLYGEDGQGLSAEDLEILSGLAEGLEALAAEQTTRQEAETARAEQAAALAARALPADFSTDSGDAAEGDEDGDEDSDEDEDGDDADGSADGGEDDGDDEDEGGEGDGVQAGSTPRQGLRVPGRTLRRRAPKPNAAPTGPAISDFAMAAPDVPNFSNGQAMDWDDMGRAVDSRLASFNVRSYEAAARAGKAIRQQFGIASIHKPIPEDLRITGDSDAEVERVFSRATDEARLQGGSLVASGGWCAPSETVYDLFDEGASRDGLISVPEVGINRGGIRFFRGSRFSDIYSSTGFEYTEEEDIDGDYDGEGGGEKPCFTPECPEPTDVRLALIGLCISSGLLQRRGFPEVLAKDVRDALTAHAHRISAYKIGQMVAGSDAVTMTADTVGTVAPLLNSIELQVEHYRDGARLGRGVSLEAVFPFWVRGAVRADLALRLGVDLISVPDSRIDGWFRERGVNPQFVYNWQGFSVGRTPAEAVGWPSTVQFLLYRAGTWVAGGAEVITLDTIYDSVNLGQNNFTALFTEEGVLMAKRGFDSRVVTVPVCSTGMTGGGVEIDCDGAQVEVEEDAG